MLGALYSSLGHLVAGFEPTARRAKYGAGLPIGVCRGCQVDSSRFKCETQPSQVGYVLFVCICLDQAAGSRWAVHEMQTYHDFLLDDGGDQVALCLVVAGYHFSTCS